MKDRTFQRRFCRLVEQMRQLYDERFGLVIMTATAAEVERLDELAHKAIKAGGKSAREISPEETPELWDLLETLDKRYVASLGQE